VGGHRGRAHGRAGPRVRDPDHRRHGDPGALAAVNDPTTAVHALDALDVLLRELAARDLDGSQACDRGGTVRLVWRTPSWADLLDLALAGSPEQALASIGDRTGLGLGARQR
jgi:hypothetical protein